MPSEQSIKLNRDCEAILVPSGEKLRLQAGSQVWLTQSLGGSYTVMTDRGDMARIAGENADALGLESKAGKASGAAEQAGDDRAEQRQEDDRGREHGRAFSPASG